VRTQDEIAGKYNQLMQVKDTKEVKVWTDTIKELIEVLSMQYINEKGEEAVRAWGVIKGLNMALTLDIIYKASIPKPNIERVNQIIKP
jgi:tetrahydromethanopterin S-methyltransferase subunit G